MLWVENRKTLGPFENKVAMVSKPEYPRSLKNKFIKEEYMKTLSRHTLGRFKNKVAMPSKPEYPRF